MNNISQNFHLNFMASLSGQIAKFFNLATELCLNQLNQSISRQKEKTQFTKTNQQPSNNTNLKQNNNSHQPQNGTVSSQSKAFQQIHKQSQQKIKKMRQFKKMALPVSHKPKAPTSSYLLFFHSKKQEISAKYGITSTSEITKAASEEWRKLSDNDKVNYIKKSQQQKVKYHQAMKLYKEHYSEEIMLHKKLKRMEKENRARKKLLYSLKSTKQIKSKAMNIKRHTSSDSDDSSDLSSSSSSSYQSTPENIDRKKKKMHKKGDDSSLGENSSQISDDQS